MYTKKTISTSMLFLLLSILSQAQETLESEIEIDPTKPTNLYTQVNANLEYQSGKFQNLYGTRANVQYAFNPDNLLLLEVPFLYNDRTSKFGLTDMRLRYYTALKRNITKSFIAIAPFADISIPSGSYENALGSSSWSLAVGVVFGFIVSPKLAVFPGMSYIHMTKPSTDLILDTDKFSSNGVGFQFNASYKFTKTTFMFFNPTPSFLNTNGTWKSIWGGDLNLNHIITPNKFKVNAGWSPNFTTEVHTFKIGVTLYI